MADARILLWFFGCVLFLPDISCLAEGNELPATFFRAVNLNGPAINVDGHEWQAGDSAGLQTNAKAFENQNVTLVPKTDSVRAEMIRTSRWGKNIHFQLSDVPQGMYQVFAYVWEDNASERFSVSLNGKTVVPQYDSGSGGKWKRLGPWRTQVNDGTIKIVAQGGAANFSGIEIWSGLGPVPDPMHSQLVAKPTEEQLAFFESKIRPLLVDQCYSCHSQEADEPGGNLLLDSRAGILQGGLTDVLIVPSDPDNSLLIKAIKHTSPDLKMPPDSRLEPAQIADLEAWVRMGAPDPRTENTVAAVASRSDIDWDKARDFWSLRPLVQPEVPPVSDVRWPSNPIDHFVLSKLNALSLPPSKDADKRVLIRRATFDLIGLPPTPEEVDDFERDESETAFEKVVNRLLESPHYGERWGRYWLDLVRYSDTAGDNSDFPIPQMHLYRDWVIDAFNRDLPYDQFVREQLAGDLLPSTTLDETRQRTIATGYIANARRFGSRVDDYPQHLTIEDTLDNLGRTFLATTINCARCHNHKFDPVTTEDYYALYGIFHSTRYPWPGIELEQKQRDLVTLASREEIDRVQQESKEKQAVLDAEVKRLAKARDEATGDAKNDLVKKHKEAEKAAKAHSKQPPPYETYYAVAEAATIEDVAIQIKGDPLKSGKVVPRRFLKVLHGAELPKSDLSSGRLQLANWIVDPTNPLTARVMVNRIWLNHFKRGLVSTANDFGRQGKSPSHPELLDWLATEFIRSHWSIKQMHRTILFSRTYRMSSSMSDAAIEKDPTNEWLSAYPRKRLDAESIRDSLLFFGGNLDTKRPGSHPFPKQTEWQFTQHNPFKAVYDTHARSVYLMTQRIQRHPYLAIFDGADPSVSTPMRLTSTTPLQALYLMNDKFVHEQAEGFAQQVCKSAERDELRLEFAWKKLFARLPSEWESQAAQNFLNQVRMQFADTGATTEDIDRECWNSLSRSLLRSNELVYID
jgi:hypothetical protein